jgi:type I restriction enzyme S subunit
VTTTSVPLSHVALPKGLVGGPFGSSLVNNDYVSAGVPVIRGTNLGFGRHLGGPYAFVSEEKVVRDLARNTAAPGDIVFTQRGTLGQVALVPDDAYPLFVVSQSQMRLRVDPAKAVSDYVYYACASDAFMKQIDDNAISTGVPHINLGILNRLTIPLPPLHEQRAIANVLGALDDKISANTKLAEVLDDLAVTLLSRLKSTVALSAVVRHHKKSKNPELLEVAKVAHFSLPAFDAARGPELTSPAVIKSSKFSIDQPSVLISKLNPRFPRVWDISEVPSIPALSSTEFLVLEPLFSSSTFLWAMLSQSSFGAALEAKVAGTSGSHQRVKPGDLLDTPVLDPREVPEGVRNQVTSLGRRGTQARTESSFLTTIRDALLPQLMSGKLRVKDAETVLEGAGV